MARLIVDTLEQQQDGVWADEDQPRHRRLTQAVLQGFGQACHGRQRTTQILEVARAWQEQTAYATYGLTHGSDRKSKRKRHKPVTRSTDRARTYWEV